MTLPRLVLAFALGGAALYGCGADTTTEDSPVTIPRTDAGVTALVDAGATPPSSDAARPDAAAPADAGARGDGGNMDSGARDGAVADSGRAQDSGSAAVDSGAPASADSGTPMMSGAADPRSAACQQCETTECDMKKWPNADFVFKDCSAFGTETARTGMGMGKLRRDLCEAAVTCMRETRCADPLVNVDADGVQTNPDATNCLCGMPYATCLTAKSISDLKGPCRDQLADAAESDDVQTLHERLNDPEFALGVADRRVMCSQNLCSDECYGVCANSADGAYCAGVLATLPDGMAPKPGAEGTCSMKTCKDYYSVRYNGGEAR